MRCLSPQDVIDFGNGKDERASPSEFALRPNLSAVRLDDGFRDEEPEPQPPAFRTVELTVRLEDTLQIGLRDPPPLVSTRDLNNIIDLRGAHTD